MQADIYRERILVFIYVYTDFFFALYSNHFIITMSFTRFHDDSARVRKQNQESSFTGRYMLNTPGPGIHMPFIEDPHMRLQKWGANLHTNTMGIESDLRGLTRRNNRDEVSLNQYSKHVATSSANVYQSAPSFVEESRMSHPAWTYKDLEQNRWESPIFNPQAGLEKIFLDNIQTRIIEKDQHVVKVPTVSSNQQSYLASPSICTGDREYNCLANAYN